MDTSDLSLFLFKIFAENKINLKTNVMEQFKNAQVIMLPTKEKSILQLNVIHNHLFSMKDGANIPSQPYQHLHIISDDEIKEGEYCYDKILNIIFQVDKYTDLEYINQTDNVQKIIATTDTSLKIMNSSLTPTNRKLTTRESSFLQHNLPQPSQQFIEKYIESYNKGEVINDVLVEHECVNNDYFHKKVCNEKEKGLSICYSQLKINPKDNTITIKEVKDSWNREEIKKLLTKIVLDAEVPIKKSHIKECNRFINKWIQENL